MSAICNGSRCLEPPRNTRREAARRRWKILARALHKNTCDAARDHNVSVRRFTTFHLVTSQPLEDMTSASATLFRYSAVIGTECFWTLIQHPVRIFTAAELVGFNNTGNVCVWPSEEVLAYHALSNLRSFDGKRVLELGGGMTCLAGLMVAKYSTATKIHLTDGNVSAIENVGAIIRRNGLGNEVTCSVLQWGDVCRAEKASYDIILSADCLFFDEARKDLVETMWLSLANDGIAMVMAPRRGDTFDKFTMEAQARGFNCKIQHFYNEQVWSLHLALKQTRDYDEDIHYPMLIQLAKYQTNIEIESSIG